MIYERGLMLTNKNVQIVSLNRTFIITHIKQKFVAL